ncbi:thioredoxin domain-containing protein [Flavihumibacter sp. UBA7668]|uniref:thioredoxin domain-containing protein n=1 Tax=Flavihumibacter sp. UBA7668 TaxID=1946542 RepID=UPI0025B933B8|nr:thioredoxin domain-containing protein [Flavihumibacter sp. UBA7668]
MKRENRLAASSSPYLRQHADNPVDWYEWGAEALEKAKREKKPLLISIGYASCHWCHQMENESFMDTGVARIMNENFVNIKVDREERPDLDKIFINACELLSGNAGWPLNAFGLPDGSPFYAGTYYEKKSWIQLLQQVSSAYHNQPGKVKLQAQSLSQGIAQLELSILVKEDSAAFSKQEYNGLFESIRQEIDTVHGGLKGAPKFPAVPFLSAVLNYSVVANNIAAQNWVLLSLKKMALGGIYDQLGGGFARYTVDSSWRIPHFEKMLSDNAQLISLYSLAFQVTKEPLYERIVRNTIAFAERELSDKAGGYYSSLNAVSPEGEGYYYTWTWKELKSITGDAFPLISNYYKLTEKGNWKGGRSILYADKLPEEFAVEYKEDPKLIMGSLSAARQAMLKNRNLRTAPEADTKILCSWNALLLTAYTDAYAALGDAAYLQQAKKLAAYLDARAKAENGQLQHFINGGSKTADVFLEDYAFLASAYLKLYQRSLEKEWLFKARTLADQIMVQFYDSGSGMFFYAAADSSYNQIRSIGIADEALPSSNALTASLFFQIGVYYQEDSYKLIANTMLQRLRKEISTGDTRYYGSWFGQIAWLSYGTKEIAVVGPDMLAVNLSMQKELYPLAIYMGTKEEAYLPLLEYKLKGENTYIYVCTQGVCKRPVLTVPDAFRQLSSF